MNQSDFGLKSTISYSYFCLKGISFYTKFAEVPQIHKEYGVSSSALSKWLKMYSSVQIDDNTIITAQQIKELQKRNAQLEEENLILKKAIAIFTPHSDND